MTDPIRTALEALRDIADFEATEPVDEWSEAAAFTAVQEIARAALAAPPASPEPEAERIDRWGDKGPCGFVHPGGTPCLIERYKHPNVVAIGHRWKPTPPASPEPERCGKCGLTAERCARSRMHPFQPPTPPESAEALRDALLDDLGPDGDFYPMRQRYVVKQRLDAIRAAERAAARATPPLTVERIRAALDRISVSSGGDYHVSWDDSEAFAAAILAELEQGR